MLHLHFIFTYYVYVNKIVDTRSHSNSIKHYQNTHTKLISFFVVVWGVPPNNVPH